MNLKKRQSTLQSVTLVAAALAFSSAAVLGQTVFTQATTGVYAPSANLVEKSAPGSAIEFEAFKFAIMPAWESNQGGVFDFPAPFVNGSTVLRGTFGTGGTKQVEITSSRPMQSVAANGSFIPVSDTLGIAQNSDTPGYMLTIGSITDATTGEVIVTEGVTQIGFTALSRTHATYPCDIRAVVTYGDASQDTLTATVGNVKGEDDTFYSFAAPAGKLITSIELASLISGTQDPVSTRIAFDDLAFIVSAASPPPVIDNISPNNYALHDPADPITFIARAAQPIATAGISLELNGTDVSGDLVITGSETERTITYSGELLPNTTYNMNLSVSNASGVTTAASTFYTATEAITLYDSEGFTSDELYPLGLLQPVTHGLATWAPHASEPAYFVQDEEPYGKVLEKINSGSSLADWLSFPPISSGTLIVELDAWVSTTTGRTIDLSLSPIGSANMASFVSWGGVEGMLAWYDNAAWQPITELQPGWHHYEIITYLSGPAAGFYDVLVDDVLVGDKLHWRNASPGAAIDRLRFHSQNTNPFAEYGRIDNLTITAALEDPNAFPPPSIVNISPAAGSVVRPGDGFQFEVTSAIAVPESSIVVTLNGDDISDDLVITGTGTQRFVSVDQLPAGRHSIGISASNAAGEATAQISFFVADAPLTIFDSDGFESETLYPEGPLQPVEDDGSTWAPAAEEPADIVNVGEDHNKVLRRIQTGVDRVDYLNFPPVASGILTIDFEARASVINERTLDICLMHTAGGSMASFLGWGTVADNFSYYNGSAWIPVFQPGTDWHQHTTVNYLSGPHAGTFDLKIDGETIGEKLPFRHAFPAGSTVGRLRVAGIRGPVGEYGEIDNLVLTVAPLAEVQSGVTLTSPALSGDTFTLSFQSQAGASHIVEYKNSLDDATWSTLETVPGDGTVKTVSDETATGDQRYYQVRTE